MNRRFPASEVYTVEQARELALLSRGLGRQIGLLIDRRGRVETVIVGQPDGILIPELARSRTGASRLRGLRLLHTHLTPETLTQEDVMDMLFLRLDAVIALTVSPFGDPVQWQWAHLMPPNAPEPYLVEEARMWDRAEVDMTATAVALEEEFARACDAGETGSGPRCVLVSVSPVPRLLQEENLDELAELAKTAGIHVCGRMIQRVRQMNPRFILGKGKMAELEVLALQGQADMLVFDGELSAAQLHNLADITERKVIDRTQLILDIFAQHAVTSAGKLQVELAQLKYTLPRLTGQNRAMDRLMGGIGGRGPGETKLEMDRRRSRERMGRLRKELENLRGQRSRTRGNRARNGIPLAALVGYTNVGKSTLLNKLTRSQVLVENKLFATLDTTTRRMRFPQAKEIILADTVGFIRSLPKELMDAFRATLEELESADLLIHVADASHPDILQQIRAVEATIEELGLAGRKCVLVLNKWDRLDVSARASMGDILPDALHVSAATGEGLDALLEVLEMELLGNPKGLAPEAGKEYKMPEADGVIWPEEGIPVQ